jgi:hypothetical protein
MAAVSAFPASLSIKSTDWTFTKNPKFQTTSIRNRE